MTGQFTVNPAGPNGVPAGPDSAPLVESLSSLTKSLIWLERCTTVALLVYTAGSTDQSGE